MKIVRFAAGSKVRYGVLTGGSIQGIEDKPYRYIKPSDRYYQLSDVKLLSPCIPSKIVALGLNYHSHAEELNAPLPNAPLIFLKPSTSVIGPEGNKGVHILGRYVQIPDLLDDFLGGPRSARKKPQTITKRNG